MGFIYDRFYSWGSVGHGVGRGVFNHVLLCITGDHAYMEIGGAMETDTALNFVRHLEDTNFQLTKTIERKNRLLMKLHDHLLYQYSGKTEEQRYSLMRELYAEAKEDHSKADNRNKEITNGRSDM